MRRRSFLAFVACFPTFSTLDGFPKLLGDTHIEPKVVLLRTEVDFDLTQILTSGELVPYEAASNTIRVDLTAEYDDGSVRNFTCDNQTWHYETKKCESRVTIGKDIIVYYCNQSDEDGHSTTVCIFKDVKESFGLKEL